MCYLVGPEAEEDAEYQEDNERHESNAVVNSKIDLGLEREESEGQTHDCCYHDREKHSFRIVA